MKQTNETVSDVISAAPLKAGAFVSYAVSFGFYFWPLAN
jgi:hypothetical protein